MNRLPQIDGLRAWAAVSVLLFHYSTRFDQVFVHSSELPFSFLIGSRGVELFFVISGFVIFMTLDATKHAIEFAVARLGRLYPTYWIAVALTTLVAALSSDLAPGMLLETRHVLANLTMVHGLFGFDSVDGVYWSLEIELLFYVWMLIIACLGWLQRIEWLLLAWLTVCLADALLVSAGMDVVPYTVRHLTLLKWLPWFALGMMVYRVYRVRETGVLRGLVILLALSAIALRTDTTDLAFGIAWIALVGMAAFGRLPIAGWRVMTFLGAISYPLYLTHQQIGYVVMLWLQGEGASPLVSLAVAAVIAVIVAWGLHRLIEKPSMKLVSRWRSRRSAKASEPAARHLPAAGEGIASWPWTFACVALIGSLAIGATVMGKVMRAKNISEEHEHLATVNALNPKQHQAIACDNFGSASDVPVLLVLGQSNAGSHAGMPVKGESVRLIANGKCFESADPLPGTSGDRASIWTSLDRQWVDAQTGARPWFSVFAVGASDMKQWTDDSLLRQIFLKKLSGLADLNVRPTAILWQQGEADMKQGTAAITWIQGLTKLRTDLDNAGFLAPLMVARSTFCRMAGSGAIERGLKRVADAGQLPERVIIGADLNSLTESYRRDTCHFNAKGRDAAARLWHTALQR